MKVNMYKFLKKVNEKWQVNANKSFWRERKEAIYLYEFDI